MLVEPFDLYKYRELFQILKWEDGAVMETKSTGKFVRIDWVNPDPGIWLMVPISTKLLRSMAAVELDMYP